MAWDICTSTWTLRCFGRNKQLTSLHSVVAVGCVRTVFLGRAQELMVDKFWLAFNVFVASVAECNLAIVCACAPSLKALFGRYFRGLTTKMSNISEDDLHSRFESIIRSTSSQPGLHTFSRGIRSNNDLNSTETRHSEVNLQKLEIVKIGRERWSFKEAHEYGMESVGRITEAYEEPPHSCEDIATVQVFLDTENVKPGVGHKGGAQLHEPPSTSTYLVLQETTSPPQPSLSSEIPAGDDKSEFSSFFFVNSSETSSSQGDETRLISTSANNENFPLSPLYVQQSPSKQSSNSEPLQPPTPAILRTPPRGASLPLSITPWTTSMGPSSRRKLNGKLSREKWEHKKKQKQFE